MNLSNFVEKLEEQMILHNTDARMLSENIGVDRSTISNWRTEKYAPSTKAFFNLIEYFECSADYMLGLIDFPMENVKYNPPFLTYGQRLRTLLKENNLSQTTFIRNMKISKNLAYQWLSDKALPSVEYLVKIAEYFDISVDILIGRLV